MILPHSLFGGVALSKPLFVSEKIGVVYVVVAPQIVPSHGRGTYGGTCGGFRVSGNSNSQGGLSRKIAAF